MRKQHYSPALIALGFIVFSGAGVWAQTAHANPASQPSPAQAAGVATPSGPATQAQPGSTAVNGKITIHGTVLDGLGRVIPEARISVSAGGEAVVFMRSSADGSFEFALAPGYYHVTVSKSSFADYAAPLSIHGKEAAPLHIVLDIAAVQQEMVIAATGVPTAQSQLGQSVEVIDSDQIQQRAGLTADETLREVSGVQVNRAGVVGGLTDVSIRGGDPGFDKIVLDGVPLQRFDFGAYDFSTLTPDAIQQIQVVRGADSVVYGTDASTGVIDVQSRTGQNVHGPEVSLRSSYGTYATEEEELQLLNGRPGYDYAFTYGYLDTHNNEPNAKYIGNNWAGNVGVRLPARTHLRLNMRRTATDTGQPNAVLLFGISDNTFQRTGETYGSATVDQQTSSRWSNRLTYAQSNVTYFFDQPGPVGTPLTESCTTPPCTVDGYLGNTVTLNGANGYSVTGQAILIFGNFFPQPFSSDTVGRYLTGQSVYQFARQWTLVGGYRYSNEQEVVAPTAKWHSNGEFVEVTGGWRNRVFASAGVAGDDNSAFGSSVNPQASLSMLPRLTRGGWFDETRIHGNAGTAQKDPNVTQSQTSLLAVLQAAGSTTIVPPIHPQRSHNFDLGVDQYFFRDTTRFSVTAFENRYDDLIAFVPATAFPQLGISQSAEMTAENTSGGAYVNSDSQFGKGLEWEVQSRLRHGWKFGASYTYIDSRVTRSFTSDALFPSVNPAFPNIPIGAFGPLVGARPFHVAPESGTISGGRDSSWWGFEANAYFASRRDDSTFLSDMNFGDSLLLPNHDLDPAYGTVSLRGFIHMTNHVTFENVIENLLDRHYQESFGYPALGFSFRLGVRIVLSHPQ